MCPHVPESCLHNTQDISRHFQIMPSPPPSPSPHHLPSPSSHYMQPWQAISVLLSASSCQIRAACYKCGTTYVDPRNLTNHINRCRGTGVNMQSNALTFTQREMQLATSAKDGPYSLQNNTYVGEAYQQQLCMPPSLAEMARLHRIEQDATIPCRNGKVTPHRTGTH